MSDRVTPIIPSVLMLTVRKVSDEWFIGSVKGAAFFARSMQELMGKYRAWMREQYPIEVSPDRLAARLREVMALEAQMDASAPS